MIMTTAVAKHDVRILMKDDRFSNFVKGHKYRCMIKGDDVFLIDEDNYGYATNTSEVGEDFEIAKIENKQS